MGSEAKPVYKEFPVIAPIEASITTGRPIAFCKEGYLGELPPPVTDSITPYNPTGGYIDTCNTLTILLTAQGTSASTAGATFQWYVMDNNGNWIAITNATNATFSANNSDPIDNNNNNNTRHSYKCIITINGNSITLNIVKINFRNPPDFTPTPATSSLCSGSSIPLNAGSNSNNQTFSWSPASSLSSSTGENVTASPTTTTTYSIIGTRFGCTLTKTITVTVTASPASPTVTSPLVYCQNTTAAQLTATAAAGYTLNWYTTPILGNSTTTAPTPSTTVAGNFTYYVSQSINSNLCPSPRVPIVVNVIASPNLTISVNPSNGRICRGATAILTASGGGGYTWSANLGLVTTNPVSVSPTNNTTYSVSSTNVSGCTGSAQVNIIVDPLPQALFSFPSGCPRKERKIQFTNGTTYTGAGNVSYHWDFGDPNSSNNTSNNTNPTHSFLGSGFNTPGTFIVTLTATSPNGCVSTIQHTVSLGAAPDPTLFNSSYISVDTFRICTATGQSNTFTVYNGSTTDTINTQYLIFWGDGLIDTLGSTWMITDPQSHSYSTLGFFNITFIVSTNGCKDTSKYALYLGSNPQVPFTNPGSSTNVCLPFNWTVPSTVTTNPPGTYYVIIKNDGSPNDTIFQNPPPVSYSHLFTNSSCGASGGANPNSFFVRIKAVNYCNTTFSTFEPITTLSKPIANFSISPDTVNCVNSVVTFTNTSLNGTIINDSYLCDSTNYIRWVISPQQTPTNYTFTGSLGTGLGISTGTPIINVTFLLPGVYTVKLLVRSKADASTNSACRYDSITKTICIVAPPIPYFKSLPKIGCNPLIVNITDSSYNLPICGPLTRAWTINKLSSNCIADSTTDYNFIGLTTPSSLNPQISFNNQGVYSVTLALTNKCGTFTFTDTIRVKRRPQVSLSVTPTTICEGQSVTPTISASACTGIITNYNWGFPGGSPAFYSSTTTPNPGSITYNIAGSYTIYDTVKNECGTTINSTNILVNPNPIANAGLDVSICSGISTNIGSASTGLTYSWSPTTGLSSSTISNPTVTLTNSTASNSVYTYILTVTNSNGCTDKDTVDVTVKPLPPVAVSASSNSICVGGSTILTASGANNYSWSPSTALSAITGTTVTASPTSTIPYTVTGTNTITGCIKAVPITVTVNPLPVFPTVTSNIGYCQGSTVSALTASTTSAGNTLLWYTTATGAVGSSTAPIPSTVVLGSTTYYVSQVITNTGCEGPRSAITVTINPNPIAPIATTPVVYCQGATPSALSATALSGNTLYWYTAATGGTGTVTAPTPSTATATTLTYYVGQTTTTTSCQSPRTMITVTINPKPAAPVSPPVTYCQFAIPSALSATALPGDTLIWYNAAGTAIAVPTPSTNNVATLTYYVSQIVTLTGCEGPRTTIVVTVKSTPAIAGTYVNPSACSSPTGSINITGLITTNSYSLNYSVNGVPHTPAITITGQTNYTLSSLTSGTYSNIYVTLNGCPSNTLAFTLTPPNPPSTPTASADTTICSGSNLSLSVTSAATTPTYTWTGPNNYTGSGATINIPNATTAYTGYFYVTVTSSNCTSLRDSVYATVNPLPIAPIVTNPVSYCQGDIASPLIATALIGNTLNWYNLPTGGTSSTLIPTPVTNNVGNTSYYVSQVNSTTNCEGPRVPIVVTINPKPIIPDTIRTICSGQSFTVSPVSYLPNIVVPANTSYTWVVATNSNVTGYSNQNTGVSVISQTLVNTTNTQQTVVYTVTPTSGSAGNCVGQIFTISVIVKPKPNARDTTFSICSGSSFIINPVNTSTQIIPSGTSYTWSISTNAQLNGQSAQSTPLAQVNQTLNNNSNIPQAIVYTVTPVSGACSGNPFLINITVNPAPKLNDTSRVICSGGTFIVSPVNSPSTQQIVPLGTIYTWTASSSANITGWVNQNVPQSSISQTLVNLTNVRDSVLYTVIPRSTLGDSCYGPSFKIKVYVDPTPKILDATSTICSGSTFIVSPSNNQPTQIVPLNTTYTWTVSTNANITGQSAQNTGQSSISQALTNLTNVKDSVIYTVIPKSPANCSGALFLIKVYVNPKPVIANQAITICGDSSFSFTPSNGNPTAGTIVPFNTTYTWTISANPNLSGQNAQSVAHTSIADTLINNTNLVQTIIYSVVPLSGYSGLCPGDTFKITVTVNPRPKINDTTRVICSGTSFTASPVNNILTGQIVPAGTTYSWVAPQLTTGLIGGVAGNGSSVVGTLSNLTDTVQTAIYTVVATGGIAVGSCTRDTFLVTVSVNPAPHVTFTPASQSICSGTTTAVVHIISPTTGVSIPWNSMQPIPTGLSGMLQSGNDSIPSQTLVNITNAPIVFVDSAQAITTGSTACPGTKTPYFITVNPAPKLNDTTRTICSGGNFIVSPLNAPSSQQVVPTGTIYTWTATSTANITGWSNQSVPQSTISQTLVNLTNVRDSVLYTVIPRSILADSCFGPSFKIKVYVDPTPKINDTTLKVCSRNQLTYSPVNHQPNQIVPSNTLYTWSFAPNANITGAVNQNTGVANFSQTLVNTTNIPQSIIYTLIPTSGVCPGAPFIVTVIVNPKPEIPAQSVSICSGLSFSLTPANGLPSATTIVPVNTSYTWTVSSNPYIFGASSLSVPVLGTISQNLTNLSNTTQTIQYTITPVSGDSGSCPGNQFVLTVTVYAKPVISDTSLFVCSGQSVTLTPVTNITGNIVPAGTSYSWSAPLLPATLTVGLPGSGLIFSANLNNSSDSMQTALYQVVPVSGTIGSCVGDTFTVTVNVNPAPHVTFSPSTQAICSGNQTSLVTIISPTPNALLTWQTSSVPLTITGVTPQSGGNVIPIMTLLNSSNIQQTVILLSSPSSNSGGASCPGTPTPYTIIVNPTPSIMNPTVVICSGNAFVSSPVNGNGSIVPANTTYSWTVSQNNNVNGESDQPTPQSTISQTLINLTNINQTVLYTATPISGDSGHCIGNSFTLTVIVKPTPKIQDTSLSVCSLSAFNMTPANNQPAIIVPSGTTYTWSILTPNSNILGASPQIIDTSSISETLTNLTNIPQVIQYLVVPKSDTCPGQPFVLTVTVNPTPVILPQILNFCSEDGFTYTPVNNPIITIVPINTTYTWTITTTNNNITGQYAQPIPQTNISQAQLVNHTNVDQQLVYTITPVSGALGNCQGTPFTITVTVNPKPNIRDTIISVCSGQSFTVTPVQTIAGNIIPTGTTYYWSAPVMHVDLSGGVSGNNSSVNGILSNSSDSIRTAVYTVIPTSGYNGACVGDTFHVTVHVNPAPRIIFTPSPQSICSGTAPSSVTIISPTPNVVIPWSTVNPPITVLGYDNNGNTTITAHTLNNLTNVPVIINYSATASTTVGVACPGAPVPYTITVNPTPKIHDTAFVICSGTSFGLTPVNNQSYNIVPINTTYTWNVVVNNNVVGQSNQPTPQSSISQVLTNLTNTIQIVQYSVRPVSGDSGYCVGNPFTITVTVNPTPVIPALYDTICSASSFSQTPMNSLPNALTIVPLGTTYSWPAPLLPIGMSGAASGTNQTSISGNLANTTFAPITITYVVTPRSGASGNCVGIPFNVFVTVNPLASISNNPLSQSVCNGNTTVPVNWSSYTLGAAYSWTIVSSGNVTGYLPAGNGPVLGSMTLANMGIAQDSVVYAVSSTASACAGPATNYTIYVNPDANALFSFPYDTACWPYAIVINNISPLSLGNVNIPNSSYNWYYITNTGISNYIGTGTAFPGYPIPGPSDSIKIKLVAISAFGCKNDSMTHTFYTKPKPAASFAMSNRDSCGPLTVLFTNQTNLTDTFRYFWNFGNGQTSNLTHPLPVTFLSNPTFYDTTYYITMHAFNECDTSIITDSVIVRADPKARFFVSSSSGCSPFTIQITNTSLGNSYDYYWDFGDGNSTITHANGTLSHTYNTGVVDTFNLMLIAQNQCGRDTQIIKIRVAPNTIHPGVSINATELYGCVAHTVSFINSSSGATSFTWDFGDASPPLVTSIFQNIVQHTYNTAGTFAVNIFMTNGCSDTTSIKQVIVYPKPIAAFASNQSIYCLGDTTYLINSSQNASSYLWNWGAGTSTSGFQPPHLFTTPGTFTISLQAQVTAPTGLVCFDNVSHSVTILNKPDSTILSNISSANCSPFNLTASMPGIINETVTWYIYDTTVLGNPIVQNGPLLNYTFNNPGTFTVHMIAENAAGCKDSATRILTVYQKPNAGFTPLNLVTCSLDTLVGYINTTTANNYTPLTYKWYVDNIQMATSSNFNYRYTTLPAVPLPRTFVTKLVAKNIVGCADSLSGTLQMNPTAKSLFSITNPNACIPFVANFADNSTYATSYSWYLNGVFITNGTNPIINITSPNTSYTITLIVSNIYACRPDTSSITFRTRVMPKARFSLNNILGCTGQLNVVTTNTSLNANAYEWEWGDALPNSTQTNPTHLFSSVGTYRITLTAKDGVCTDTTSRVVIVARKPTVNFMVNNLRNCDTSTIRLINITSNADSFHWVLSNGMTSTLHTPTFTLLPSSTPYTVQLIAYNQQGCSDSLTKPNYIRVFPPPIGDFYINPAATISIPDYTFSFTNLTLNSILYQYEWSLGDGTFANTRDVPDHLYPDTGSYPIRLIVLDTSTNCTDTVMKIARIEGYPGYLYVPNAFYPNSIRTEFKSFKPVGKGLQEYELQIFDSWGKLLFKSTRLDVSGIPVEGWDGTFNGMPMPQDAYAWYIKARFRNGKAWGGMQYNQRESGSQGHTFGTITLFR